MSVQRNTDQIALLTEPELRELSVFLFHLRQSRNAEHQSLLESRLSDRSRANWLTLSEFERRLEGAGTGYG